MGTKTADRLAVLIDAENINSKHAAGIFEEVASLGEASLRRIYGDFSGDAPQGWDAKTLTEHAIVAHQQFANSSGKNSSDIALVIDAMDILYSNRFDGFVLVSSDSDFTRLASRIREHGLKVFGIGEEHKSSKAFVAAYNRFIYIENIEKSEPRSKQSDEIVGSKIKLDLKHAAKLVRKVVLDADEPEGWVKLGRVGHQIREIKNDFDPRSYGHTKLSELVRATGKFEEKGSQGGYEIRCKD